jgi:ankyrin repeat protein
MWAFENGYKELAQLLIEKGVNMDARNHTGWTALIWASVNGHKDIVELLIQNGANLNIKNIDGWNALVGAIFKNHYNVAKLIVDNGIVVNSEDKYLLSAFRYSLDKGYESTIQLLINNGLDNYLYKHIESLLKDEVSKRKNLKETLEIQETQLKKYKYKESAYISSRIQRTNDLNKKLNRADIQLAIMKIELKINNINNEIEESLKKDKRLNNLTIQKEINNDNT